jgi:hypothetical protein
MQEEPKGRPQLQPMRCKARALRTAFATADNPISQLSQPRDRRQVDAALGEQSQHRFGPLLIGDDQRVIGVVVREAQSCAIWRNRTTSPKSAT